MVGQADLAGPRRQAAADQAGGGDAVMGGAKRPSLQKAPSGQMADDRIHGARLQSFLVRERRQYAGEGPSQQCFAGSRHPDHQQMVSTAGGDLEGSSGNRVADDLVEVDIVGRRGCGAARWHRRHPKLAVRPGDDVSERCDTDDVHPLNRCGLAEVGDGHDQMAQAFLVGGEGDREYSGYGSHGAVQTELPDAGDIGHAVLR